MWTVLHVPVINVPGFGGENGLPIGISLVTSRYRDVHLIKVAEAVGPMFEKYGNWKSPLIH